MFQVMAHTCPTQGGKMLLDHEHFTGPIRQHELLVPALEGPTYNTMDKYLPCKTIQATYSYACITGEHSKWDQIQFVKIGKYEGLVCIVSPAFHYGPS